MSDELSYPTTTNDTLSEHIDNLGISILNEWKEALLGELVDVVCGFAFKSENFLDEQKLNSLPIIKIKNVANGNVHLNGVQYHLFDDRLSKFMVEKGDILIAMTGNHPQALSQVVGVASKYNLLSYALINQRVAKIISKSEIVLCKAYIYYFLKDLNTHLYLASQSKGSANQANISKSDIENIPILQPPSKEQKAIAAVLSSLDDKIDLLHRQNKTLEAMAETLFRQWFIEEAKEDWEEMPLGDVALVQNGYAFSSKDYVAFEKDFLEVFKMGHIAPGGGLRFSPKTDFVLRIEKLNRWVLNKNDIVMAMTDMKDNMGILGHPAMIDSSNKYVLNQRVARIYIEKSSSLASIYLLYLQLSTDEAISLLQSKANSGVQVNLSTDAIKSLPIIVPPKDIQHKVTENIEPIFNKIECNRIQIQTLEKLRDNLLPKLMSGEVRVSYEQQDAA